MGSYRQNCTTNEQVRWQGWRSGATVERKIKSMVFKITEFSDELLASLNQLNEWPKKVKIMQKLDWKITRCEISKTEGNEKIDNIKCFTTRPDTLFGFSLAVSVDHPISNIMKIISLSRFQKRMF